MANKKCQSCGKMVHPNTKRCKYCGENPDAVKPVKEEVVKDQSPVQQPPVQQPPAQQTRFMSNKTAKPITQFISIVGWLILAFSITGFIMAFIEKGMPSTSKIFGPLLGVVGGVIIIIMSHLTRSVNEIADKCGEIVSLLKSKQPK